MKARVVYKFEVQVDFVAFTGLGYSNKNLERFTEFHTFDTWDQALSFVQNKLHLIPGDYSPSASETSGGSVFVEAINITLSLPAECWFLSK